MSFFIRMKRPFPEAIWQPSSHMSSHIALHVHTYAKKQAQGIECPWVVKINPDLLLSFR